MSLSVRENLDRTRLTSSSFADPLQFASLYSFTNEVSKLRTQSRLSITFSLALHYVMAKIVPVVQLAAHAKSSTLYGRTVVRSYGRTVVRSYGRTVVRSYGRTVVRSYNQIFLA